MPSIKLLICYHKKFHLFKDNVLTPIHVGRALSNSKDNPSHNWLVKNMIGDDTGENISKENGYYNEMTALYWAWKNYDALGNPDYIGLMHYRRHFVLDPGTIDVFNIKDFDEVTYLNEINYSERGIKELVEGYDFLPHIGKVNNIYRHYTENQRKHDLDTVLNIVEKKYPDYVPYMESYLNGDCGNFCNMCIFSKKLFFEYCEWIFSILEEFKNHVNIDDKRFFVSERLTGLFVHKLMRNSDLKYKPLPISFIDEPINIHVALSVAKDTVIKSAISLHSIMKNAEKIHSFYFHLLGDAKQLKDYMDDFLFFEKEYSNCRISFIETNIDEELLPLMIPELLPSVKKCIFIRGDVIALKDISEFYRICSVDDYFITGVPKEKYDPRDSVKTVVNDLFMINCARMRKYKCSERISSENIQKDVLLDPINKVCVGEVGYIPWYLFTSERLTLNSTQVFISEKKRSDVQRETLWRPFLIYDFSSPIENNQGIFSKFWWDMYRDLPLAFQKLTANLTVLKELYANQQKEINVFVHGDKHLTPELKENRNNEPENYSGFIPTLSMALLLNTKIKRLPCNAPTEAWRSYSLIGKLKFYYQHNGLKQTIKYALFKIRGKSQ